MPVPYTIAEDKKILDYVVTKGYELEVGGNLIWKKMEQENVCPDRSWESLKNRFKRHIKLHVGRPEYGLTIKQVQDLKSCWINNKTVTKKNEASKQGKATKQGSTSYEKKEYNFLISDSSDEDGK